MSLKERVTEDMKAAMRAKDSERLGTIRMITAGIKQREVDERITLDDIQVLSVIEKMIKTRKESVEQFKSGGRDDLVARESKEIELLQGYLPAQLSDGEVDALIREAIAESGATSIKEMGKAMALLKQKAQGRADMAAASAKLKAKLLGLMAQYTSGRLELPCPFLLTYAGALLAAYPFRLLPPPVSCPAAFHNTLSTS